MNNLWFNPKISFIAFPSVFSSNLGIFNDFSSVQLFQYTEKFRSIPTFANYQSICQENDKTAKDFENHRELLVKTESDFCSQLPTKIETLSTTMTSFSKKFGEKLKNETVTLYEKPLKEASKKEILPFDISKRKSNEIVLPAKTQISNIIQCLIDNFGKIGKNEMIQQRMKYAQNTSSLELFDLLSERYSTAAKCREEMIRITIRKALTFMRNKLKKEHNLNFKQASLALCKKYFLNTSEMLDKTDAEKEHFDNKVLECFLPYKKNSRNKTPNTRFRAEAFLSQDFFTDYVIFLSKFDEIMRKDNEKKMVRFVDFVHDCVKNHSLGKIRSYKRLPWVDSWVESTKVIAHEILERDTQQKDNIFRSKFVKL